MGEILGLGLSHYPGFIQLDHEMPLRVKLAMESKRTPAALKDPRNWPAGMQAEWSDDNGLAFAARHRAAFVAGVRRLRAALDDFQPELVVVFGDDQAEEFREIVPPFCVFLADEIESRPFQDVRGQGPKPNVWGEPADQVFRTRGHPEAAQHLVREMLGQGFDIAYLTRPRFPRGLAHAFIRTVLYLDYDRQGWEYPLVPFHINAYGTGLAGYGSATGAPITTVPPSPSPARAFEVGGAVGRIMQASPWRVALVASSSWSHGTLTKKYHQLHPDVEADRRRYQELQAGNYTAWRDLSLEEVEDCGQNELLNWVLLAGAMHELDYVPAWTTLSESYTMNSSKCAALFTSRASAAAAVPAGAAAAPGK